MQFIRDSLSFSFSSTQGSQRPENGTGAEEDKSPRGPSRSDSTLSDQSQYATVRSKVPLNLGSPPSAYSTPFQSPVIASRALPTLSGAAATLNGSRQDDSGNGSGKPDRSGGKVYFIEQGHMPTDYELPERPRAGRSASRDSGVTNPGFTNDSGATVINMSNTTQPSVIREQYWTWSCRCHRELTPREKTLIIVIFVLVLIIGGLATYLGIVVDSDDGITGGILTRSVLQPVTDG